MLSALIGCWLRRQWPAAGAMDSAPPVASLPVSGYDAVFVEARSQSPAVMTRLRTTGAMPQHCGGWSQPTGVIPLTD
jgi:hypothetical protein